ncbi:MAG: sensor histidine kinase [Gammaproteobacteria bacterium]
MMQEDDTKPDFSSILASTIHDMKNSLGVVLNSLDELIIELGDSETSGKVNKLQYEASRVNNNLIQLLSLYKMENTGLKANINEYSVEDFLEECVLLDKPMLDAREVKISIQTPPDLWWYFDRDLMSGVVGNAINNALRYTKDCIEISADEDQGYLVIRINDNGEGFPQHMISGSNNESHGVDFSSGRTGLGLYFTSQVAQLHKNKEKNGRVEMSNGQRLGGACFSIYLP